MVITLGLTGAGVLAAAPFLSASADSGSARLVRAIPSQLDATDNVGPEEPGDPVVTVTVTATPEEIGPTEVTTTVTVTPTKTKKPKNPAPPTQAPVPDPDPQPTQPPVQLTPPAQPTPPVEEPTVASTTEPEVELPPATTPAYAEPSPPETPPAASTVPVELREAAPEFDEELVSKQLSIPALILVLLALFALLLLESRLRRVAHAAAVRKAGPRPPVRPRPDAPGGAYYYAAYPAGGGYAQPGYSAGGGYPQSGYPAGTAYAPIISFVPVQTYPAGYPQGHPVHPGLAQGYPTAEPGMPPEGVRQPSPESSFPDGPHSPSESFPGPQPFGPPAAQPPSATSPDPRMDRTASAPASPATQGVPAGHEETLTYPTPPAPPPTTGRRGFFKRRASGKHGDR